MWAHCRTRRAFGPSAQLEHLPNLPVRSCSWPNGTDPYSAKHDGDPDYGGELSYVCRLHSLLTYLIARLTLLHTLSLSASVCPPALAPATPASTRARRSRSAVVLPRVRCLNLPDSCTRTVLICWLYSRYSRGSDRAERSPGLGFAVDPDGANGCPLPVAQRHGGSEPWTDRLEFVHHDSEYVAEPVPAAGRLHRR